MYPLLILESIISFSYKGASPALIGACAERGESVLPDAERTLPYPHLRLEAGQCAPAQNAIPSGGQHGRKLQDCPVFYLREGVQQPLGH